MSRVEVLGVGFDSLTRQQASDRAMELIREHRGAYMVTPNPEIVMATWDSAEVCSAVNGADLVIPDGIGVIKAAAILGTPLPERVPGIDVACDIMRRLSGENGSVYLLGARPGVAEKAAENIEKLYPGLRVAGCSDGYSVDGSTAEKIGALKPGFVLVCLGVPKQELWMSKYAGKLDVGLMAGLGGTLDVLSGEAKRAPELWQRLNVEWLYRCFASPERFGKITKFPGFLRKARRERAKDKSNGKR